jgi:hypothetical protein
MAIPSEFVEREYESLFIQELNKRGSYTWSPGQTDEFLLGFDGASWVNPLLLMKFGFPTPTPIFRLRKYFPFYPLEFWHGERLTSDFLRDWQKFADNFFPPKALNFFVQHKRPVQMTEQGAAGDHWKKAYFSIKIDKAQQRRLEMLEDGLGQSGVVTYAGAAFLSKAELWKHQEDQRIIASSNFVSAKKLREHSRYTYIEAGHTGFANEEPTIINDDPILDRLNSAFESSELGFSAQVKRAGKIVDEIMSEDDSNRTGLYFTLQKRILDRTDYRFEEGDFFLSVIRVNLFCMVNSTSWLVISRP